MRKILILIGLLLCCALPNAQQVDELQKLITDILETMAEQDLQSLDYEELVNDLIALNQNPINLNTADKSDLEQLFFLNDFQIENLLFYRYENKEFYSIYELQGVEKLDSTTISYMLPFVTVAPIDKKHAMHVYGNVLTRIQSTFQTPEGYRAKNDTTPAAYLGSKEKLLLRGRLYFGNKAEAGFTLEKDQGEQLFPNQIPITDFSSAFVRFNKPLKFIDTWIIGDYRLSFGQGLGVWTDMAFSKSTETAQLRRRAKGLNAYTSVNETSFLRGSAIQFSFNNLTFLPFASYKRRDANIISDTIESNISSLQESGYHRTLSELENRHSINETIYGVQSAYHHHLFHIDAGYANWSIDQPIAPKEHPKDQFRFTGDVQQSVWLAHTIFLNRLTIFGEAALQNKQEYGIFQGLTYNAGDDFLASLAYRKYSLSYTAVLSNPFSESSTQSGESGIFASVQFKPSPKLKVKAFADFFSYNWMRFNVYRPSSGFEWFAQIDYRINYQNAVYLRYKSSQKEINAQEDSNNYAITDYQKDNIRLFYAFKPNDKWRLQTQLEHSFYINNADKSNGYLAFQDVKYRAGRQFAIAIRYSLFDIDDYNSRIYAYEPDVLYAFNIPAYFNKGSRIILNLNYSPIKNLRIWARLAHTQYANLSTIGSSNQLIKGNQLSEFKVQIQYQF